MQENVIQLCRNVYGSRVIQCILQHGDTVSRAHIHEKINENLMLLMEDHHGNYVIQTLMGMITSLKFMNMFIIML